MLDGTEVKSVISPCLILAHANPAYERLLERGFRRLGWDVYLARSGPEARRLVRMLEADVVILEAALPEESGWLTCDKLTREQPLTRVILVSDDLSPRQHELAVFVGASALIHSAEGMTPLLDELIAPIVPAAS